MEKPLSRSIHAFIAQYIGSVQQLEVLLVISKDPAKEWTTEEVATKLGFSETSAGNRLMSLWAKGLVKARDASVIVYRYQPKTKKIEKAIDDLRIAFGESRDEVLNIISSGAEGQIRSLADAFKFEVEDDDDR